MNKNFDDFLSKYQDEFEPQTDKEDSYSNLYRTLMKMMLRVLRCYHEWISED